MRLAPILLGLFAIKLALLASLLPHAIPPDESTHFGLAHEYSQVALLPSDRAQTASLGVVAHQPFLYYWIAGKALFLYPFAAGELVFLRLLNCALGLATAIFALRWIRLVSDNATAQNLFVLLVTSTLMFTGLFAAVSYDNLANTLAAAALYFLYRHLRQDDDSALLPFGLAVAAGCVTKVSFLPLALILTAALVALRYRELASSIARVSASLRAGSAPDAWLQRVVALLLLVFSLAAATLYGGNLARYGQLTPELAQIVSPEIAMTNRIHARKQILEAYRSEKISLQRAIELADRIRHPADRRSTKALLAITQRVGDRRLDPVRYLGAWGRIMLDRTYGYFGHRVHRVGPVTSSGFAALLLAGCVLASIRLRSASQPRLVACALAIALAYTLVLIVGVNRPNYMETGLIDLAVQGRYLFPILLPLYGIVAIGFTECLPKPAQLPSALIVGGWFAINELPRFLVQAGSEWFQLGG